MKAKDWFLDNPMKSKDVIHGLNKKYGNFDFKKSSRSLYKNSFKKVLSEFDCFNKKVVFVGGNDGHEVYYLHGKPKESYIVDLAKDALKKVSGKNIYPIYASAEKLPFIDSYFDFYFSFRTLFSEHVSLKFSLKEAKRIIALGGTLIISIPNGYLVDGKITNGMFDYRKNRFDADLPKKYLKMVLILLKVLKFKNIRHCNLPGEILIFAKNST